MKRLFSNKSGFSLAEIIVAIAIFAIMMAMIMQMLQLSISQRNANYEFAKDLAEQQNQLVANGKDTTKPKTESGDPDIDDTLRLNFVRTKADGTEVIVFKDAEDSAKNKADGIPIDYKVRGTDTSDVNNGLNYFIGDFDYDADGVGGGGDGSDIGAGQISEYDTRISGIKGLENISVSVEKVTSVPGESISGKVAYKMTVNVSSGSVPEYEKRYSHMKFYFYSSKESDYTTVEVNIPKMKADGSFEKDADGNTIKETYYKKVPKKASLEKVVPDSGNKYTVDQGMTGAENTVRIGLPIPPKQGEPGHDTILAANKKGFESSVSTTFYLIFKEDPVLTASSFGEGSSTVYNRSPVYDEKTGTAKPGKTHVNIYGSYPFKTSKTKDGTFTVGGAK